MVNFVKVCPYCRSKSLESAGATGLRTGSDVVNYRCNSCGKTFPPIFTVEVEESLAKE